MHKRIILALTGASGMAYGLNLLQNMVSHGLEVHLIISRAAREIMEWENYDFSDSTRTATRTYSEKDISAPFASGSWPHQGMVVCPCSMASLAAIAQGVGNNLIHRAADVTLKERRKLILVPRETPLNRTHLTNMLAAHDAGACIFPPMPGFYTNPGSIDDLLQLLTSRIMDGLGIKNELAPRWGMQNWE